MKFRFTFIHVYIHALINLKIKPSCRNPSRRQRIDNDWHHCQFGFRSSWNGEVYGERTCQEQGRADVERGDKLEVSNADEVILYVAMATNFCNYQDISSNPEKRILAYTKNIDRPYSEAKSDHIKTYQKQFGRVKLNLGDNRYPNLPTDERIRMFSQSDDAWFAALYFQFGRYLLISCSQPGTQPANLQGIWNASVKPS